MAFEDGSKKEIQKVGLEISNRFPLTRTTLASMESLSLPVVQEVVLSADMQCEKCQKRVADIIAKMNGRPLFYIECGLVIAKFGHCFMIGFEAL
ncbi:hypothetical protein DEO72_LG9g3664 [Vigna unguiculata]|uniref:HMA domain-containing protein n=1 Tax=Vigna unguiculata TaxID=3917 RepID=A0A4D6N904_VIGUN|nr:hypothetical protein DEO72_LG9g3664 [Vigna unguiculata]